MIEIIPAIDLIDGKCVRLVQGDFAQATIYNDDPLEVAQSFEAAGVRRLHIVDLDGARSGKIKNLAILRTIAKGTDLVIDFGGGIKTGDDIQSVFEAGASIANIGSTAVRSADLFFGWLVKYGGDKILLGADVRDGKIAIDGWQTATEIEIVDFLRRCYENGLRQCFVTDIAKDGLMQGSSDQLYEQIIAELPDLKLIASGGVSRIEDVADLERIGCNGVIIGKAIYEGRIALGDICGKLINVN